MLYETLRHVFRHPWNDISIASWRKYPNTNRPDILSVDIIDRSFDPETGILRATRLITSDPNLPSWLRPWFPKSVSYCVEESEVDPRNKRMVLRSRNYTGSTLCQLTETCTYTPSATNSSHTDFRQDVEIDANLYGIASRVESAFMERFTSAAVKGREIMEDAVATINCSYDEFVEDVEEFVDDVVGH
tara:strand:+ start:262 stop:825 length:564 start_codon:yes stop_codon:yes gene_type:complete